MQLSLDLKGPGYHFTVTSDHPRDAFRLMDIAEMHEAETEGRVAEQLDLPLGPVASAPIPQEDPTPAPSPEKKSHKKKPPVSEKPAEAAPAPAPAEASPATPDPAKAGSKASNGHPDPPVGPAPEEIKKKAMDACVVALARDRERVQQILGEFGVTRFRDLGSDVDRLQMFHDKVILIGEPKAA